MATVSAPPADDVSGLGLTNGAGGSGGSPSGSSVSSKKAPLPRRESRPPPPFAGPSQTSSRYTRRLAEGLPSLSTHEIDFSDVAVVQGSPPSSPGAGLRHHKSRAGSDLRVGRNGRSIDAGRLGEEGPSPGDGGSLSWASRPPREEGGIVTEAIAQTERADSAKHQAIMPWLFQDEESQDSYSRHARTPTTGSYRAPSGSMGGLASSASQSTLSLRPVTPPGLRSPSNFAAAQQLPATASSTSLAFSTSGAITPLSSRKSRNPFHFLRKKSSAALRDPMELPNSSPPSARVFQDARLGMASSTSLGRGPPLPPTPAVGSAFPPRSARASEVTAVSVEDELAELETTGQVTPSGLRPTGGSGGSTSTTKEKAPRRGLRRPRTRDRDRSRPRDDWAGEGDGSGLGTPFATTGDVELSLDMNFEHIDDIVDTSMRQRSVPTASNDGSSQMEERPISADDATSLQNGRRRSTSFSALSRMQSARARDGSHSPASPVAELPPSRPQTLRRLGSTPSPLAGANFTMASQSPRAAQINVTQQPGLRRITAAEAQQHLASRQMKGGDSRAPGSSSPALGASSSPRQSSDFAPDDSGASTRRASSTSSSVRELRKDSATSSLSQTSGYSGVSPKTSLTHLPLMRKEGSVEGQPTGTWTRSGLADPTYRFPPPLDGEVRGGEILAARKSSASSTSQAASTWMAPDSWAVQPDGLRDYLRDEDGEGASDEDNTDNAQASGLTRPADRRGSGATSGTAAGTPTGMRSPRSPSLESGIAHTVLAARRGTHDSNISSYSSSTHDSSFAGAHPSNNDMHAHEEETDPAPGPLPTPATPASVHSSARPSSRGGAALAAAGGAAAAAAGKLGLHRPLRHKSSARPNTAGSMGGRSMGSPIVGLPAALTEDDLAARSVRGVIKRPSTVQSQQVARPHIMRIYKQDGTHATVAISLYATTSELRTVMMRKWPVGGSGAFRLFVTDKGHERPLGEGEKPALLQRRRMVQAGYTEDDTLEELGAEDLSYLLKFVYRPDSVTKFDSESFGNTADRFRLLDLKNYNLEMVPIFLYRHADWIGSLDLSGNPMSDLPLDFVQLCTSLHTLRLSHLALKRIPGSVRQSETLTHLDVSDNRIPELSHIALDEMAHLTSLKVQNNRLMELPSYFARIQTLRYLNISNNRFEVFPTVLCDVVSLVELDVSFNAISALPEEIGNLTRLERLVLVGNSLETLPSSVGQLVNLQTVDVRRNVLQDVSVLFSLPRLQVLQCEHNSLKTLDAAVGQQLRSLDIGHNPLSRATLSALEPGALTSLNLSSSNMSKLDEAVFQHLPSLQTLILDRNQFVSLPDSIGELSQLDFLSCTSNLLASLPESLGKLTKLRRLHLHNNNLKTLPATIWLCSSLSSINVSSNLLESFPAPPLGGAAAAESALRQSVTSAAGGDPARKGSTSSLGPHPNGSTGAPVTPTGPRAAPPMALTLRKLRIADNRLTDDIFGVLGLLTELEVLNLSFNEIYEIPNGSLSKFAQLTELYLSGNNLSSIPADDLPRLKDVRVLHLNANKLQTLPAELKEMRRLANLDVGNNTLKYNITNQQYDWNWNSSPALRYLNLSGNKRLEIKGGGGGGGGQHGRSRRYDAAAADFHRMTNLRVLGLMDVTVTLRLEEMPDGNEDRRVRSSESHINGMSYGIADALGKNENLSIVDALVPKFRTHENEGLFGLFAGRHHGTKVSSRLAHHLAQWAHYRVQYEVKHHAGVADDESPEPEQVPDILRRAFLRLEKDYADLLLADRAKKVAEARNLAALDERRADAPAIAESTHLSQWRAGASGVLAYVVDRTLHIANVGDALAVLSRNGSAQLVSTKHEPFDRDETQRIRSAEGWVSLRGHVNDKLDVSRSFGYYHLSSIVNAAPAVTTIALLDSDEFVILANRTLWDHISYQTAVDIARMERDDVMIAAQKLRDFAISYGAEESIMVMVVAVGDLFYNRQQRHDAMPFDPMMDAFKKGSRMRGVREDLPGDRTLARLEREVAPPIGQVALVFTDIKNSTALWETNGGMQSAMRLHNYLLRRQLRTIGGYEVKTEGDAFMVSFPSVTAALLWCFTVQIQLLREDWPQELLECEDGKEVYDSDGELIYRGLSVRMGIHWGFPVCEADPITRRMDYFGPMVNRAARISSAADGGQIMASRDVIQELTALLGSFGTDEGEDGEGAGGEGNADEDALRLLHPNVARDVVLLRRMGFGISSVGERRLKGLETPEMLEHVYPKQLSGRLAAKPDAPAPQVFEPMIQLLDINEIKQLGMLCLRLEALSNGELFPGVEEAIASAASAGAGGTAMSTTNSALGNPMPGSGLTTPSNGLVPGASLDRPVPGSAAAELVVAMEQRPMSSLQPVPARRKAVEMHLALRPELLIYAIRDDAPDAELAGILQQLTSRIVNALSTLTLRHLTSGAAGNLDLARLNALFLPPP